MRGLIFVGMVGPDSHNQEERRFVEELSRAFDRSHYLRGVGIKGLRFHQIRSLPGRLASVERRSSGNTLRHGSLFVTPFRKLGRRVNAEWLRRQLTGLMGGRPEAWTLWLRFPSPELVDAIEEVACGQVVYEPIDLYSAAEDLSPDESRRILKAEERILKRATVVTGGLSLAERFRTAAGGSHWLPFGRDTEQRSIAPGLPVQITRPRLCLVGCLDWRVDEALLVSMLTARPRWQLVLAGPRVRPWGRQLEELANVHWLGRIPVERVRPVIRDCDVTLVPYRLTDWTRNCLPVKVFEYLGEGKPVVATLLPELHLLADVVGRVPAERFMETVQEALIGDNPNAQDLRRRLADRFTLQGRARRAVALLEGTTLQAATQ